MNSNVKGFEYMYSINSNPLLDQIQIFLGEIIYLIGVSTQTFVIYDFQDFPVCVQQAKIAIAYTYIIT